MESRWRFVLATTPQERTVAYQLRYRVFVEELNYNVPGATPEAGLAEETDSASIIVLAYHGSTPAGTLTVDWWPDVELGSEEIRHLQLDQFARTFGRESVCIVRKAAIAPDFRKTALFMRMLLEVADRMLRESALRFVFVDCSPYLIKVYERLGFRRYAPHFYYDANGSLSVPLCLVLNDHQHLSAVRSPLLPVVRKHGHRHDVEIQRFFDDTWGGQHAPPRTEHLDLDSLVDPHIEADTPLAISDVPLFAGIPEANARQFLGAGSRVTVAPGQQLIGADDLGRDLYLITSGYVEVTKDRGGRPIAIATMGPGDLLGEMNMLLDVGRTASVVALTEVESYRFPEEAFRTIYADRPALAAAVNLNLARILARRLWTAANLITQPPPL